MAVIENQMPDTAPSWLKGAYYKADFDCMLPWIVIKMPNSSTAQEVSYRGRAQVDLVQCLFDAIAAPAQAEQRKLDAEAHRKKYFHNHVCASCSPDGINPGKGCINCRMSGMDQSPCPNCPGKVVE